MNLLYESESFALMHVLANETGEAAPVSLAPTLERHGFEIVDKRSGKEVYLDGSWAEMFQMHIQAWQENFTRRAMIVMATGLGKTYTAAEVVRRLNTLKPLRALVLAHTNEIVYQLERAFWPFLKPSQETLVWNGYERPNEDDLQRAPLVFACLNSVASHIESGATLPDFDIILIVCRR
jgi:superfamily II DNA or RNA helicase